MKSEPPEKITLYSRLKHFFESDDWHFTELENRPMLTGGFRGNAGSWRFFAQAKEEQGQLFIYSVLDAHVPAEKLHSVAEFITRANYGLSIGNFELDFSDGELRYKTSVDVTGNEEIANDELIKQMVYVNMATTDQYFAGLMSVIFGDKDPKEVIESIENRSESSENEGDSENNS